MMKFEVRGKLLRQVNFKLKTSMFVCQYVFKHLSPTIAYVVNFPLFMTELAAIMMPQYEINWFANCRLVSV